MTAFDPSSTLKKQLELYTHELSDLVEATEQLPEEVRAIKRDVEKNLLSLWPYKQENAPSCGKLMTLLNECDQSLSMASTGQKMSDFSLRFDQGEDLMIKIKLQILKIAGMIFNAPRTQEIGVALSIVKVNIKKCAVTSSSKDLISDFQTVLKQLEMPRIFEATEIEYKRLREVLLQLDPHHKRFINAQGEPSGYLEGLQDAYDQINNIRNWLIKQEALKPLEETRRVLISLCDLYMKSYEKVIAAKSLLLEERAKREAIQDQTNLDRARKIDEGCKIPESHLSEAEQLSNIARRVWHEDARFPRESDCKSQADFLAAMGVRKGLEDRVALFKNLLDQLSIHKVEREIGITKSSLHFAEQALKDVVESIEKAKMKQQAIMDEFKRWEKRFEEIGKEWQVFNQEKYELTDSSSKDGSERAAKFIYFNDWFMRIENGLWECRKGCFNREPIEQLRDKVAQVLTEISEKAGLGNDFIQKEKSIERKAEVKTA